MSVRSGTAFRQRFYLRCTRALKTDLRRTTMPAKNHEQWTANPPLERGEWVDSRIYSDPQIFEEELEKIFKRTWIPVCHESELPKPYDFRTTIHRARADHRLPRTRQRGARLSQRVPASRHAHRAPPVGQLPRRPALGQPEAHDLHVPCLAVRHEGQLRLHQPREGRLPGPAVQGERRPAAPALRGEVRRLRLGQPRRQSEGVA